MTREAAMAHLDTYLIQVRRYLRGVGDAEANEVLAELRSHVLDRIEGVMTPVTVEAALSALGSPREIARLNAAERVAATMERDRSVLGVLRAVWRMATISVMGAFVFMVSLFGYGLAAGFLVTAAWKPFDPRHVGLWRVPDPTDTYAFSLGVRAYTPGAVELLGWYVIPVGLLVGAALGYLTWRFGRAGVRFMARRPAHAAGG